MNTWVKFLEERNICHPDMVGNMPCDNGNVYCDKCKRDYIINDYKSWMKKHGYVDVKEVNMFP